LERALISLEREGLKESIEGYQKEKVTGPKVELWLGGFLHKAGNIYNSGKREGLGEI